jgi:signal transduction histidine kinase
MELLMWSSAMAKLTGISSDQVTGSLLENVVEPWGSLLSKFALSPEPRFYKQPITLNHREHWITLHKASIPSSLAHQVDGQVLILEDVTELQMLEKELVHSERLASIGRLAAGVAHEIGNPVTGIACLAQNLKYDTDNPDILETGAQILSQTDRVSRIVQSLVSFSHAGQQRTQDLQPIFVRECADEAINLLSLQRERKQVAFINLLPKTLMIRADSQRIIQVFINLLSNSRDASPEHGQIHIDGVVDGTQVKIGVTDQGSGIRPELIERVFEPFFTTKDPGEGTGLGLAMVYTIIKDHHGTIEIESPAQLNSQNGTRFIITLPINLASSEANGNTVTVT